ncbi:efflux RND transporter periplasmic adaptor subunit [Gaoshiqia sp. Z1-71]|uniref:efflux RND transporter periplasmic adaptor subunit n=1 Tax=Gaoshiqia hydrogeniformans TaxID=3290090 RepID=UPI003BF7CA27
MKQFIFLLIAAGIIGSCSPKNVTQPEKSPETDGILVKLNQTEKQNGKLSLNYSGITEPRLTVPLSFQLPGTVACVLVNEGDPVQKGQLLAEIDPTTYESAYRAALAAQIQAQDAYNRLKKVYDHGSLPEIKWEEVKSQLEQAKASARIAKKNLDNCRLISPITGLTGSRNIETGETATPGLTVFHVISVNEIYARISAPENEINKIEKGQKAKITFPALGEKAYEAEVEKIGVVANTISKTFEVKMNVKNQNGEIKPGMVCNVSLQAEPSSGPSVLVPVPAVLKDALGTNFVYVVDRQTQTATRRDVQISGIINNQLCITAGLHPGEWFVVEGQHKLSGHSKVRVN